MALYKLNDLSKVKQIEQLDLKNTPSTGAAAARADTPNTSNHILDLKAFQVGQAEGPRQHRARAATRRLDSIAASQPAPAFHLINRPELPTPSGAARPRLSHVWHLSQLVAAGLLVVFVINLGQIFSSSLRVQSTLISSASSGVDGILAGVQQVTQQSPNQAQTAFGEAENNFNQALEKISFLRTSNIFSQQADVRSLENMLSAGQYIAEAGQLFTASAGRLQEWPTLFLQANQAVHIGNNPPPAGVSQQPEAPEVDPANRTPSLTDQLRQDLANISQASGKIAAAKNLLADVNITMLPEQYREGLGGLKERLDKIDNFLSDLSEHFPAILELLGDRYPHRYLLLLQNDTEARPTGGFIGSLLIVDINDGLVSRADFHDVYQYDGQLNEDIAAPEEIARITDNWRLRDSNYSPDFAISAEKAAWFLQKSKGPSVDTVIAINQSAIGEILADLGPLRVPPLHADLDSNNFQMILGYLIESKYFGEDHPKVILGKTIEAFRDKILQSNNPAAILQTAIGLIRKQKIIFYSRDEVVQAFFERYHLTPHQSALEPQEDFLQVVATSIGGNKSDLYITQNLTHNTFIEPDGTVYDELTIERRHNWTENELHRYNSVLKRFGFGEMAEGWQQILGRGDNKVYLKVYLPLGAELETSQGVARQDILVRHDSELKKTTLLFPMTVAAGTENQITLRYRLPFRLDLSPATLYRFTAQNQLTLVPTQLKKTLQLSPALTLLATSRQDEATTARSEEVVNLHDIYQLRAVVAR